MKLLSPYFYGIINIHHLNITNFFGKFFKMLTKNIPLKFEFLILFSNSENMFFPHNKKMAVSIFKTLHCM